MAIFWAKTYPKQWFYSGDLRKGRSQGKGMSHRIKGVIGMTGNGRSGAEWSRRKKSHRKEWSRME